MFAPRCLTAFLGYLAVAVGLLFDLGLPWNIWHMIVYWNPHSPLFEVGWCVMLYLTVLALEFFPVRPRSSRALAASARLVKARLPLVIVGIGLSTLHQSSLGSLFLIMPYRLHPLWYSPILPVLFLISAIGAGTLDGDLREPLSRRIFIAVSPRRSCWLRWVGLPLGFTALLGYASPIFSFADRQRSF